MNWFYDGYPWRLVLSGLASGLLASCASAGPLWSSDTSGGYPHHPHANIPPGAIPVRPGTYLRTAMNIQATKAEQDDFVIYLREWYMQGTTLGPYGCGHLAMIAKRLPTVPFNVIIEPSPDEALNKARVAFYVANLTQAGVLDAAQRVVVGFSRAGGLYGEELEPIYTNMLNPQNVNPFGTAFGRNMPFGGWGGGWGGWGGGWGGGGWGRGWGGGGFGGGWFGR